MSESSYQIVGYLFDIMSAIVSLLDLTTDVIIMITWYTAGRMIFFWISVCILILAQLSYVAVFYFNHGTFDKMCLSFVSLICTLPFTPILSFIFYVVADDDSNLRSIIDKFCVCFHFNWNTQYIDPNTSPQRQFLEKTLYKHLGFIMESLIEAFPQSILQLTFIVHYKEPNFISILSILISMTSVCSKILLLSASVVRSRGWKLKIFIWLCFVVDFCGAFFVVSFAFYTPSNLEYQSYFLNIRNICFIQFIICILPFAFIGSVGLHVYWTLRMTHDNPYMFVCWFLGITILWIVGLFTTFLIMCIFCTIWIGFGLMTIGISSRLPYTQTTKSFYQNNIEWILNTNNAFDKTVRLAMFNKAVLDKQNGAQSQPYYSSVEWSNHFCYEFYEYLKAQHSKQYKDITINGMRNSCNTYQFEYTRYQRKRSHKFWINWYYQFYASYLMDCKYALQHSHSNDRIRNHIAVLTMKILTWITGPFYAVSRFFVVSQPMIFVLYLYIDGGIIWFMDMESFQIIMWSIYILLLIIWFVLLYHVIVDEYYLWFLLPHANIFQAPTNQAALLDLQKVSKNTKENYGQIMLYPLIEKLLLQLFGVDITPIVIEYFKAIQLNI